MLKQRIITAIVLISITLLELFFLPKIFMFFYIALMIGVAGYEWSGMLSEFSANRPSKNNALKNQWVYVALVVAIFIIISKLIGGVQLFILLAALMWVALFAMLLLKKINEAMKLVAGLFLLPAAGLALWQLFLVSPYWMLAACLVVWIADTAAYFAGKRFGKRKLAPTISPGKTIEGFYGAVVAVLLYAIVLYIFSDEMTEATGFIFWILSFIVMTAISVLGDLFESQLKRDANMKDSGKILPGHGGVFDRIDSLIAVAPFFALLVIAS